MMTIKIAYIHAGPEFGQVTGVRQRGRKHAERHVISVLTDRREWKVIELGCQDRNRSIVRHFNRRIASALSDTQNRQRDMGQYCCIYRNQTILHGASHVRLGNYLGRELIKVVIDRGTSGSRL